MVELQYSASLTGEPLQFYESKVVAQLLNKGLSFDEIKFKVYDENLFNYTTKKSIYKRVASVYRRLKGLDESILRVIVEGSGDDARVMVLFSVMLSNRLFFEFMTEVVRVKFLEMDLVFETREVDRFFDSKRQESEKVSSWHDVTVHKLSQVFLKMLRQTHLLSDENPAHLQPILVSQQLRDYLVDQRLDYLLDCVGG
jgi:hypothetical protein